MFLECVAITRHVSMIWRGLSVCVWHVACGVCGVWFVKCVERRATTHAACSVQEKKGREEEEMGSK